MPKLKAQHVATVGRVRLTLLAGNGARRTDLSDFIVERRQDPNSEEWYPAAGYKIDDLDALAQVIDEARRHRTGVPGKTQPSCPNDTPPAPSTESATPSDPAVGSTGSTGPAAPPVVPEGQKPNRSGAHRPAPRPPSKKKTRRVATTKDRSRARSR